MNTDGRCILVVEDEPLIRFALCDCLVDEGFHVLEAGDALSAVAVFGMAPRIDAVISDVDMPGYLSGLDLMRLVISGQRKIPMILTSGRLRDECGELPEQVLFVPKPYDEVHVVALLLANLLPMSDRKAVKARA